MPEERAGSSTAFEAANIQGGGLRSGGGLILGIESSCDETAAAVVRGGAEVLSSVVASQVDLHAIYGGVVPELASREHLRNIVPVVRAAMARAAEVDASVTLESLDAIAVTEGPGLAGALLVGITYAKAMAFALRKPLLAVNHLEGHIYAVLMQHAAALLAATDERAALVALVVSGGHTHLYLAERAGGVLRYRTLGRTVDDAAGEAYDKVAKLLGLPYPGGPWIDALAPLGDATAVPFRFGAIRHRAEADGASAPKTNFDFSFSGIKTAVLRHMEKQGMLAAAAERRSRIGHTERATAERIAALRAEGLLPAEVLHLAASFQAAVVGRLMQQTFRAVEAAGARAVLVTGGVAANAELRRRFADEAGRRGLAVGFPTMALSTDNAAMIAAAAWPRLLAGERADEGMTAQPQLRLDTAGGRPGYTAVIG